MGSITGVRDSRKRVSPTIYRSCGIYLTLELILTQEQLRLRWNIGLDDVCSIICSSAASCFPPEHLRACTSRLQTWEAGSLTRNERKQ
jgi:hypothetical protein